MPITSDEYKQVMRQWASGVTIVTMQADGFAHGLTVAGFVGLSLEPPLVLISIGQELHSHTLLNKSHAFAVNILRDDQRDLSDKFAGRWGDIDRFSGVQTRTESTGSPVLTDCVAWLDCQIVSSYQAGDHTIYIGEVVASGINAEANPLLYWNGDYRQLGK
ncbi:MAG TPA: flavin reductase family protein [Anaerolineae bacterium]|nr:flavin reductase family protein [Anaerolineae bacterium]